MTSRNLLNLGLLAVVAILIVLVIYEPGLEPEPVNPVLTQLQLDDINHIYIQRDTDDDVELKKVDSVWQMLKPYPVQAHDFRVQTILRLAEAESLSRHELTTLNKTTYGLDKPGATVTFNKKNKVLFGNNEPLQQHRYVQYNDTLHTITDTFYYQVASKVSTFIDHRLLPGDSKITKLELPELVIEFKDGKWLATPQPGNFSVDLVTGLLNTWRNTQAIEIAKTKSVKHKAGITVHIKDKQPLRFTIVKNDTGTALVREDISLAYNITPENFNKLTSLAAHKPVDNDVE